MGFNCVFNLEKEQKNEEKNYGSAIGEGAAKSSEGCEE